MVSTDCARELLLKRFDVRTQWGDPTGAERFRDVLLFAPAHVRGGKVESIQAVRHHQFLCEPRNGSIVACPSWEIPCRMNTVLIVCAKMRMSSSNERWST